jgi:hypothetical protein
VENNDEPMRLRASYLFMGRVIAWHCPRCLKLFSLTAEEALANLGLDPPPAVVTQFHQHDCAVCLYARLIESNPALERALSAEAPPRAGKPNPTTRSDD